MKVSKDALRQARQLFQASFENGHLSDDRARKVVKVVAESKPRHYLGVLHAYQRLVRLELHKRQAVVESATVLSEGLKNEILTKLKAQYGGDVSSEFRVVPELLGGTRVRVGSDIWDGSVRARIERLQQAIS